MFSLLTGSHLFLNSSRIQIYRIILAASPETPRSGFAILRIFSGPSWPPPCEIVGGAPLLFPFANWADDPLRSGPQGFPPASTLKQLLRPSCVLEPERWVLSLTVLRRCLTACETFDGSICWVYFTFSWLLLCPTRRCFLYVTWIKHERFSSYNSRLVMLWRTCHIYWNMRGH